MLPLWIRREESTGLHMQDKIFSGAPTLAFVHGCALIEHVTQAGCCSKMESWMTMLGPEGTGKKNALRGGDLHLHNAATMI